MSGDIFLSKTLWTILCDMLAAETQGDHDQAEIVCDSSACYVGNRRIARLSVTRLLQAMAISDRTETGAAFTRFSLNGVGRAIARRPAVVAEINKAVRDGRPVTIRDDRVVVLDRTEGRKTARAPNRRYTPEDVAQITSMAAAGESERAIARALRRHPGSVAVKCARLGIRLLGTAGKRSQP